VAGERRGLLVSRVWVQATLLVVVCGFFILGLLAYRTYMAHPPVPKLVVDSRGHVLYTGRDIQKGQQVFLHNGLMEYGSAFGHGAYLGPDFTADYLRRSADLVRRSYGRVPGADARVHAAGDAAAYPIKHGGLGAQMADTAAASIAQLAGAEVDFKPFLPVIRAKLLSGGAPLYLSARLVGRRGFESEVYDSLPWPEDQKVVAEELGPYLAGIDA
jgi:hypothetical protein